MTVQWTLVASFLYCELAFITLLLLPFISPNLWKYVFESRICKVIASKANIYFSIFIAVLSLFFLDSIREMRKYSSGHEHSQLGSEIQMHMKLFRSQRNFYISGFSLFLWFVIRRLVMLISEQASLLDESETSIKRAQIATETAQKLLKQKEENLKVRLSKDRTVNNEVASLQERLIATENELRAAKTELSSIKSRAEAVSKEYDQLLENYASSQDKCSSLLRKEE